ncbi:MAG: hypothetical protein WC860_01045 [Candidatus Margulisiibacteriota bacterium]|jgi:hypothetical protein
MDQEQKKENKCKNNFNAACNPIYGLGLIGAAVYYISTAKGFWLIVLGLLKALIWPAFLVYGVLKFLGL